MTPSSPDFIAPTTQRVSTQLDIGLSRTATGPTSKLAHGR